MRGDKAKQEIINKIIEIFGQDNCIVDNKKLYINTREDGAQIQIALSLACPKQPVVAVNQGPAPIVNGGFDFEKMGVAEAIPVSTPVAEITQEEKDNIASLLARLGL